MFVSLISIIIAHCSLLFNFLQTYTYIVRDGQRRRDAGRNKMELQRRRLSVVQAAEREGKLIQKRHLTTYNFILGPNALTYKLLQSTNPLIA